MKTTVTLRGVHYMVTGGRLHSLAIPTRRELDVNLELWKKLTLFCEFLFSIYNLHILFRERTDLIQCPCILHYPPSRRQKVPHRLSSPLTACLSRWLSFWVQLERFLPGQFSRCSKRRQTRRQPFDKSWSCYLGWQLCKSLGSNTKICSPQHFLSFLWQTSYLQNWP